MAPLSQRGIHAFNEALVTFCVQGSIAASMLAALSVCLTSLHMVCNHLLPSHVHGKQ